LRISRLYWSVPQRSEELLEQFPALRLQNSAADFKAMIQAPLFRNIEN
jgi:hypothetical protein